jgi:DNA-binding response OmpR family regulator
MPRVLLLEDDPLVLMMLSLELQAEGFEVIQAETAREAVGLLGGAPDVLVCDLDLRDRHDGYDLACIARAHSPAMAVLYTSGVARPEFAARKVAGGVLAAKPLLPQEIARRVRALLPG